MLVPSSLCHLFAGLCPTWPRPEATSGKPHAPSIRGERPLMDEVTMIGDRPRHRLAAAACEG